MTMQKVAQNEQYIFYVTSETRVADDYAARKGLVNLRILLAENEQSLRKDYVVLDGDVVVFATQSFEELGAHIDMLHLANSL